MINQQDVELKFRLIDIISVLSINYDAKIGVNGNFVGQFSIRDIPYRYLNLYVKCIYPLYNGEKQYTGIDLVGK